MKNNFLTLLVALLACCGTARAQYCVPDARFSEVAYFDTTEITVGTNVQYGIALDHLNNPDTLRMDLYYPSLVIDTAVKRPFVMMFHGGGFVSGDKASGDIRDLCVHLAMRGFVCASVNYRLGFDASEYGQYKARYRAIQDGKAAMRFVVNSANAVRVDTSWLFVGGQSAGALLALGMVYADEPELDSVALLYGSTATSVALGGLNTSGNSLTNAFSIKGIFNNWGGAVASEVDADEMLPTVAFHGALDSTVLIDADPSFAHYTLDGSRELHNDLLAEGVCSELTVDLNGGHGIYRNASSVFRAARASCFFKSLFCDNCASFYTTDSIPPLCSSPAGVGHEALGDGIRVFPNPCTQSFRVEGGGALSDLRIYDGTGRMVHRRAAVEGECRVELAPGIYLLSVRQAATGRRLSARLVRN